MTDEVVKQGLGEAAGDGIDDVVLLDRWCAGDNAAGSQLFRRYYRAIFRFFQAKIDREIDEAVQQTFLVCVRKRDEFRRHSSFRTFLFAIARLVLHEYWRRLRRGNGEVDFEQVSIASLSTSIGSRIARREERGRLIDALRELPLDQQLVLELHYWERLDGGELAAVFHVEPATVRSRLFRARDALRARLAAAEPNSPPVLADADFDAWARGLPPIGDGSGSPERGDR